VLTVRFSYTLQEEMKRMRYARVRPEVGCSRVLLWVLFGVAIAGAMKALGTALGLVVGIGVYLVLFVAWRFWLLATRWSPDIELVFEADDDGFVVAHDGTKQKTMWSEVRDARATDLMYILQLDSGCVVLPRRAFPPADATTFHDLVWRHAGGW